MAEQRNHANAEDTLFCNVTAAQNAEDTLFCNVTAAQYAEDTLFCQITGAAQNYARPWFTVFWPFSGFQLFGYIN